MKTETEYNYEWVNEFLRKETVSLITHVLDHKRYKKQLQKDMIKNSLKRMYQTVDQKAENLSVQERAQYYKAIENLRDFLERTK